MPLFRKKTGKLAYQVTNLRARGDYAGIRSLLLDDDPETRAQCALAVTLSGDQTLVRLLFEALAHRLATAGDDAEVAVEVALLIRRQSREPYRDWLLLTELWTFDFLSEAVRIALEERAKALEAAGGEPPLDEQTVLHDWEIVVPDLVLAATGPRALLVTPWLAGTAIADLGVRASNVVELLVSGAEAIQEAIRHARGGCQSINGYMLAEIVRLQTVERLGKLDGLDQVVPIIADIMRGDRLLGCNSSMDSEDGAKAVEYGVAALSGMSNPLGGKELRRWT